MSRIYAVIDVAAKGLVVREMVERLSFEELVRLTGVAVSRRAERAMA